MLRSLLRVGWPLRNICFTDDSGYVPIFPYVIWYPLIIFTNTSNTTVATCSSKYSPFRRTRDYPRVLMSCLLIYFLFSHCVNVVTLFSTYELNVTAVFCFLLQPLSWCLTWWTVYPWWHLPPFLHNMHELTKTKRKENRLGRCRRKIPIQTSPLTRCRLKCKCPLITRNDWYQYHDKLRSSY